MTKSYITNSIVQNLLKTTMQLSLLLFGVGFGLATTIAVSTNQTTVYAQVPNNQPNHNREKTISQESVLFVNPSIGDDNSGNGTETSPFKTITRSLQVSRENTTIILSRGTYSSANGEEFPLIIKPGISLQGDTATKGRGIIIQGSGEYLSRSFGRQNATLVVGNNVAIAGITITNPEKRGYGMLIESTNPQIIANTFSNSIQDGISVAGTATPKISQNYFYRNGANGITISGSARPEISENIFQQTGFGINIAQNAAPIITGNQIQSNRTGIIVQANAQPILRNNLIQANREDGLVTMSQANPDLGNDSEPGNNEFRNNARYDINANAAKQIIVSVGNTLNNKLIAGRVSFRGAANPIANNTRPTSLSPISRPRLSLSNRLTKLTPTPRSVAAPTANTSITNTNTETTSTSKPSREIEFAVDTSSSPSTPPPIPQINRSNRRLQASPAITPKNGFPTPSSLSNVNPTGGNQSSQINYLQINSPQPSSVTAPPPSIEFSAPQGIQPPTPAPTPVATVGSFSMVAPVSNVQGMLYRVVVPINSNNDEELVRFLAPGAFRTSWQGQNVIQVGVFSNTFNAEQMIRVLNNNGLKGMIQPLN